MGISLCKYFQMLLEKFKFCDICVLLELSKPYLEISPAPLKSSIYCGFLLNFSCKVMCLAIPPIKIWFVGEIFGVKKMCGSLLEMYVTFMLSVPSDLLSVD